MAIITSTIGTAGQQFSIIQSWEDSLPVDAVAAGNSYVGECYNTGPFAGGVFGGTTTGPSNTVTLKCAAGHSFRDNANVRTNALRASQANGVLITSNGGYSYTPSSSYDYFYLDGLQVTHTNNGVPFAGPGNISNSIIEGPGSFTNVLRFNGSTASTNNVLVVVTGSGVGMGTSGGNVHRNTAIVKLGSTGGNAIHNGYGSPLYQNVVIANFGNTMISGTGKNAASANNATTCADTSFTTNNNLTFANLFVDTTNDFRLKAGSPLINAGGAFGLAYDITGTARPQGASYDIGPWEYAAAGSGATATPSGVSASSAVGSVSASGQGRASPVGVSASASVGTASAAGATVISATASPAGVGAAAAVGSLAASGAANRSVTGVSAVASVGTVSASGATVINGSAFPAGVAAPSAVGAPAASGTASASPAGVSASALVGSVSASGATVVHGNAAAAGVAASSAVGSVAANGTARASPSGVQAAAAVGAASANGGVSVAGNAQPAGVAVVASVGTPSASGATVVHGNASAAGVAAAASVGTVMVSASARAMPAGVSVLATIGQPIASGQIQMNGTALPAGVVAYAYVGQVQASSMTFARAPAGPGYSRPFTNTTRPHQVNTRRTR